jgi:glycosyltransferase involved in cell wall biosynthesis
MKLVINTAHQRFGGAIQVALSFINECISFQDNEYHIWIGQGLQKLINKKDFPNNFHFYDFDFGVINFKAIRLIQKKLSKLEDKIKPDVIISTSGPTYFHSKAPQIIGYNLPLYIYPESPFVQEMSIKSKLKLNLKKIAHFYYFKRDAIAYVTQTDDVKHRVKQALKSRNVHKVTNTASNYYQDWKTFINKLPERKSGIFRFITISSYYRHKNLEIIPKVLEELHKLGVTHVEFVLTLKAIDYNNHIGKHQNIINVGPISPQECPSLYNECDALFLPTLAECFSASYPEAMIMNKPIITTNLGFAKSICNEAALYFKPKDPKSAAKQIINLISDIELQKKLQHQGQDQLKTFDTPKERAEKYLNLCSQYSK